MITAISNMNSNISKTNLIKQNTNSKSSNITNNLNSFNENFTNTKQTAQIAFTGNPLGLTKMKSNLSVEVPKITEKVASKFFNTLKKLNPKEKLPVVKKPIIAATESTWTTNSKNLLSDLAKKGIDPGTVKADSVGGISASYKPGISSAIDKGVTDGKITAEEAKKFKNTLQRFCGRGTDDVVDNHADDIIDNHGDDIIDVIANGIEKIFDFFGM